MGRDLYRQDVMKPYNRNELGILAIAAAIGLIAGAWLNDTFGPARNELREEKATSAQLGEDLNELRASVAAGLRIEL